MPYSPLVDIFIAYGRSLSASLAQARPRLDSPGRQEDRQAGEVAQVAGAAGAVEVKSAQARAQGSFHILQTAVADVQARPRRDPQAADRVQEDPAVRLLDPD